MATKVQSVLLGILIGVLLAMVGPAGAHHSSSNLRLQTKIGQLTDRIEAAEFTLGTRISTVESSLSTIRSDISSVKSSVSTVSSSISTLNSKTSQLSTYGTYTGDVEARNINKSILCGYGDVAVWDFSGLSC